jgi:hypothetical protein
MRVMKIISALLIGLLWLLAFVMAGATGLELFLRVQGQWRQSADLAHPPSKYDQIEQAYKGFGVDHLNPEYLFFFPLDPRERVALSNKTCSLDADGFRGPGPAHAGPRRLAFLLGGSAAFGYLASSDATTITGYLNRLQDEYFFVNAGVVGWNSTQELFRVAFQILDYRPALVVVYDGANDGRLVAQNSQGPVHYPVGTPENFAELVARVDERSPASAGRALASLERALFPEVNERINARFRTVGHAGNAAAAGQATTPESVLEAGADLYLSNLARIRDLTTARGARFLAVFQPMAQLHRHLPPWRPSEAFATINGFHRTVLTKYRHDFEFHDFGNLFDQYYATLPVLTDDVTDATIFLDDVHLYDPGNEIVARELAKLIR